jgi:hypothetical protein
MRAASTACTQEAGIRFSQRFHPLGQTDGVSLRRVVHAQVVTDAADDDGSRVEAHSGREADAVLALHLGAVAGDLVAQVQRRVAGALGVIFMRDRRPEESHDAVAGVLVHGTFEAVHPLGEDGEELVEDRVPLLRVELLGQLHRARHVGEQHRHLLALAFERGLRLQNFLGEMLGRVG